ncbi:hypothetical protein GWK47_005169 [Chionoecetes opilio]|uniref:Uncharacterized protein n=1 Tax=Chionoecetes opilio TaxID=41210 RepID=A0A8J4YD26_CHIOP|nr:hypothetical protein GWK47_005169 [Chionoecetes opilio]
MYGPTPEQHSTTNVPTTPSLLQLSVNQNKSPPTCDVFAAKGYDAAVQVPRSFHLIRVLGGVVQLKSDIINLPHRSVVSFLRDRHRLLPRGTLLLSQCFLSQPLPSFCLPASASSSASTSGQILPSFSIKMQGPHPLPVRLCSGPGGQRVHRAGERGGRLCRAGARGAGFVVWARGWQAGVVLVPGVAGSVGSGPGVAGSVCWCRVAGSVWLGPGVAGKEHHLAWETQREGVIAYEVGPLSSRLLSI